MKIRLSELKKIIRNTLREQGWVPGRWYPGSGTPIDDDDVALMGRGGLGAAEKDKEEQNEEDENHDR